jgi:hypothetical protein
LIILSFSVTKPYLSVKNIMKRVYAEAMYMNGLWQVVLHNYDTNKHTIIKKDLHRMAAIELAERGQELIEKEITSRDNGEIIKLLTSH